MNWYDKAVDELERQVDAGEISQKEFHKEMRELNYELESVAEEAADRARRDVLGDW